MLLLSAHFFLPLAFVVASCCYKPLPLGNEMNRSRFLGGKSTETLQIACLIEAGILDVGIAAETMAKVKRRQIINLFNALPKRFPITRVTTVEFVYSTLFGFGCLPCALFSFEGYCYLYVFICMCVVYFLGDSVSEENII